MRMLGRIVVLGLAGLLLGSPAWAQVADVQGAEPITERVDLMVPVDQTISDLDPLGASQRWVDPGGAMYRDRSQMYHNPAAGGMGEPGWDERSGLAMPQEYQYRGPGVRVWMDRPEYWVQSGPRTMTRDAQPTVDGAYAERIPAGAVFDLLPPGWGHEPAWAEHGQGDAYGQWDSHSPHQVGPTHGGASGSHSDWHDQRIGPVSTRIDPDAQQNDAALIEHYNRMFTDPFGVHE